MTYCFARPIVVLVKGVDFSTTTTSITNIEYHFTKLYISLGHIHHGHRFKIFLGSSPINYKYILCHQWICILLTNTS